MYTGINGGTEFAYSSARLTVTGGSAAYIKYSNASVVLELCPFMFSSQKRMEHSCVYTYTRAKRC
jgi:hypothetical protein